jgi:hypothetical protein
MQSSRSSASVAAMSGSDGAEACASPFVSRLVFTVSGRCGLRGRAILANQGAAVIRSAQR